MERPMEDTLRRWCTPRQNLVLDRALQQEEGERRECFARKLLAAKIWMQPEKRAQLDGLVTQPDLNGKEVQLLGQPSPDDRVPVRVKSTKAEIRVSISKLHPPREKRRGAKQKQPLGVTADPGSQGRKVTELALELGRRRADLLEHAENLALTAQHLSDHLNYINTQAEKLQEWAVALRKRFAIVQGLYKSTKDPDKILQLQVREDAIRTQEASYNANVEWLRAEQAWLSEQPAIREAMAMVQKTMVQAADGKWIDEVEPSGKSKKRSGRARPSADERAAAAAAAAAAAPAPAPAAERRCAEGGGCAAEESEGEAEEGDLGPEVSFEELLAEIKREMASEGRSVRGGCTASGGDGG